MNFATLVAKIAPWEKFAILATRREKFAGSGIKLVKNLTLTAISRQIAAREKVALMDIAALVAIENHLAARKKIAGMDIATLVAIAKIAPREKREKNALAPREKFAGIQIRLVKKLINHLITAILPHLAP